MRPYNCDGDRQRDILELKHILWYKYEFDETVIIEFLVPNEKLQHKFSSLLLITVSTNFFADP